MGGSGIRAPAGNGTAQRRHRLPTRHALPYIALAAAAVAALSVIGVYVNIQHQASVPVIRCAQMTSYECVSALIRENGSVLVNVTNIGASVLNIESLACNVDLSYPTNMTVNTRLEPGATASFSVRCYNGTAPVPSVNLLSSYVTVRSSVIPGISLPISEQLYYIINGTAHTVITTVPTTVTTSVFVLPTTAASTTSTVPYGGGGSGGSSGGGSPSGGGSGASGGSTAAATTAATTSVPTATTTSTATTATTTQPPASAYWIYADSLNGNWTDWSYTGTANYSNTDPVYSGTHSIRFVQSGAWGSLLIESKSSSGASMANYAYLDFYTLSPDTSDALYVFGECYNGCGSSAADWIVSPTGSWVHASIPVNTLDPSGNPITGFGFETGGPSGTVFYVDNLSLRGPAGAPTTTTMPSTTTTAGSTSTSTVAPSTTSTSTTSTSTTSASTTSTTITQSGVLKTEFYYTNWWYCSVPVSSLNYSEMGYIVMFASEPSTTYPYYSPIVSNSSKDNLQYGVSAGCDSRTRGVPQGYDVQMNTLAHQNGTKTLLSLGGEWGTNAQVMDEIISNELAPDSMQVFVNTTLDYAYSRGYDGVEIDFEWPNGWDLPTVGSQRGYTTPAEMTAFLDALRAGLDARWGQGKGLLALDAATVPGYDIPYFNVSAINRDVNLLNLETYDLAGSYSGYNIPLNAPTAYANYDGGYVTQPGTGPLAWEAAGVQASRIVLLLSFDVHKWNVDLPGQLGSSPSWLTYSSFLSARLANPDDYHWDDVAKASWVGGNGTLFQSGIDTRSIPYLVQYARSTGISTVGAYDMPAGYVPAANDPDMPGAKNPLVRSMYQVASGTYVPVTYFYFTRTPKVPQAGQQVGIGVTAANLYGESGVTVYVDGNSVKTCQSTDVCNATVGPFQAGTQHTYYAESVGNAPGNTRATSQTYAFNVVSQDTTPPSVSFVYPTAGSAVANTVTVNVSASDTGTGVASVRLYAGNTLLGNDTSPPYTFQFNTWLYSNGTHTLAAYATDGAGNTRIVSETVTVDNQIPPAYWVYSGAINSGWYDLSYGTATDYNNTSPVYNHTHSISADQTEQWGTLSLQAVSAVSNAAAYSGISFYINGGSTPEDMTVLLEGGSGGFNSTPAGTTSGSWQRFFVPMNALDPGYGPFSRIDLISSGTAGNRFYVDDLELVPK